MKKQVISGNRDEKERARGQQYVVGEISDVIIIPKVVRVRVSIGGDCVYLLNQSRGFVILR